MLLPGWPLWSPSMSRPKRSCKPEGGLPLIESCTGFASENALLGVSSAVSFAALYAAGGGA